MSYFARGDQFKASLGIDPALPAVNNTDARVAAIGVLASGLIRPAAYAEIAASSSTTMAGSPMWLIQNPKNQYTYVYDSVGSVYQIGAGYIGEMTQLGDLSDGGNAKGNGGEYYDNYAYFARNTTIARYGPLDGTPTMIKDYWGGTLGLTPLSDTTYPLVEVGAIGKYAIDLVGASFQHAYILGANQTNLGIIGDLTIEGWVNFRSLPNTVTPTMGLTSLTT